MGRFSTPTQGRQRWTWTRLGALMTLLVTITACGGTTATPIPPSTNPTATGAASASTGGPSQELINAAKAEGQLTVIALPHDWLNYGEMIAAFSSKYGIKINELDPNAGSGDEIEAIKANKDNKGPQAPDVIDVGFAFGPSAKAEGLLQPYKVSTWDDIPADLKDPDGYWYGGYYGALAFMVNTDVVKTVPQDWADLLKPEYKGQVALAGDPRTSNQAIQSVYAAALANGGSLDNAIVLTDVGMLNETPLRYTDEFVRHKILDIIGDFALLGMQIAGKITAEKSGHAIHASLMAKLLTAEHAWEIV